MLLVFHQTHNLSRNKFARVLENQPISAPRFFNPQQMFLLRVKLIKQGEKRETSTETCNETMLRDKLRVFVSRTSPPLETFQFCPQQMFPSLRSPRNIIGNNVSSFTRALSERGNTPGLIAILYFGKRKRFVGRRRLESPSLLCFMNQLRGERRL